ncbi:hypothetical protein HMPREF0378_0956 [Eubacterium nodatum ATCC 33099]|nr:hypothetical protein HMPREF0378_0956 [Eubacterium nodatum ATCC 33099]
MDTFHHNNAVKRKLWYCDRFTKIKPEGKSLPILFFACNFCIVYF